MIEVLYSDEDIIISVEYLESKDICFIHSKVNKWSLSKYKKYLSIFAETINLLKELGINKLYAVPPSDKEEKWELLFGFFDTGYKIKNKYKLMRLDL